MALPAFSTNGLLPATAGPGPADHDRSPYFVSMTEVVRVFGTTAHRRGLLRNLIAYRGIISAGGYVGGLQFLDGSFVENVEAHSQRDPRDIDVFTMLNLPARYRSDIAAWNMEGLPYWINEIQNQPENKRRFNLDTYALLLDEFTLIDLLKQTMYWYSLFSHQRDTFAWKGFVAVHIDPADDAAASLILGEG